MYVFPCEVTDVNEWLSPSYLCQTTVGSLAGSSACTIIAVLAELFFLEGNLLVPKQRQDLNAVLPIFT